jgi:hypothetical protein
MNQLTKYSAILVLGAAIGYLFSDGPSTAKATTCEVTKKDFDELGAALTKSTVEGAQCSLQLELCRGSK